MNPATLVLAVADSAGNVSSSDTALTTAIAAIVTIVGLFVHGKVTFQRQSKGERSADERRQEAEVRSQIARDEMERRLREAIERQSAAFAVAIEKHEAKDDRDFVRKEVYMADQRHTQSLSTIMEELRRRD